MRVTGLRLVHYRLPLRVPYVTAAGSALQREGLVLQLVTDGGVSGLGEVALLPHDETGLDALVEEALRLASPWLGRELTHPVVDSPDTDGGEPRAVAGLGLALWDAWCRGHALSLARVLNPNAAPAVDVNALVTAAEPAAIETAARRLAEEGFETLKLKVAMAADVGAEAERVAAARRGLGASGRLRLDANGAWTFDQARSVLQAVARYTIEYVEQPFAPGEADSLPRLRDCAGVPIALDEEVADLVTARRIAAGRLADVIVLKPLQLGPPGGVYAAALAAGRAGLGVVVTTALETGIGTAAALHLAAALNGGRAHGLATLPLLEDDLIQEPGLPIVRGRMRLPPGPGLGVEVDEAALARYGIGEWRLST